VLNNQ